MDMCKSVRVYKVRLLNLLWVTTKNICVLIRRNVDVTVTFPVSYKLICEDCQALQSCQSGTLVWSFHQLVAVAPETCSQKKMINNVEETEMFQLLKN